MMIQKHVGVMITCLLVAVAILMAGGPFVDDAHAAERAERKCKTGVELTICHIPPGNPDNAQLITISCFDLPAHLAHGDKRGSGSCKD